ncbi:MAG: L-2-amino-thiazoline-4-carboxylic acid hydrolase [Candidatus Thorarchaeota archaeon]
MEENNFESLPSNPTEAQGMLIKAIFKKFGKESLPMIREILGKQGRALGLKIRKKLPDNKLSTVAKAFSKSFDQKLVNVVAITDEKFQIQGTTCPFGLENTTRELCEAVMEIDYEYFRTAVSDKIRLKIIKSVAEGDSCCDTVYELK